MTYVCLGRDFYNPIYKADRVFDMVRDEYFPRMAQRVWDDKIDSALRAVVLNPGDVLNLLVGLKRAGLAVLFITHDLSLGNYISDRTVILRHGAIVETGPTARVFGNPQHAYTKALLAAAPQLHTKWQASPAGTISGAADGATTAAPPTAPSLVECEPGHLVAAGDL